jgi:hypothetical protein
MDRTKPGIGDSNPFTRGNYRRFIYG